MDCNCKQKKLEDVQVIACQRGYLARLGPPDYDMGRNLPRVMFAFDKIEDLADWLTERFGNA